MKKGFTLIEVLASIVILSVIIAIAIPAVIAITNRSKTNMYCSKLGIIEKSAISYGTEKLATLNDEIITVQTLIDTKYIKVDDLINNKLQDPRDRSEMNALKIRVYVNNNRVYAKVQIEKPEDVGVCK